MPRRNRAPPLEELHRIRAEWPTPQAAPLIRMSTLTRPASVMSADEIYRQLFLVDPEPLTGLSTTTPTSKEEDMTTTTHPDIQPNDSVVINSLARVDYDQFEEGFNKPRAIGWSYGMRGLPGQTGKVLSADAETVRVRTDQGGTYRLWISDVTIIPAEVRPGDKVVVGRLLYAKYTNPNAFGEVDWIDWNYNLENVQGRTLDVVSVDAVGGTVTLNNPNAWQAQRVFLSDVFPLKRLPVTPAAPATLRATDHCFIDALEVADYHRGRGGKHGWRADMADMVGKRVVLVGAVDDDAWNVRTLESGSRGAVRTVLAKDLVFQQRVLTGDELVVKRLEDRGFRVLTDDEVVDTGAGYVVWENYDPDCTVYLHSVSDAMSAYTALARLDRDDRQVRLDAKVVIHPRLPVRVIGWVAQFDGQLARYFVDHSGRQCAWSQFSGVSRPGSSLLRGTGDTALTGTPTLTGAARALYLNQFAKYLRDRRAITPHRAESIKSIANGNRFGTTSNYNVFQSRGVTHNAGGYADHAEFFQGLGAVVRRAPTASAADFLAALVGDDGDSGYRIADQWIDRDRQDGVIRKWNARCRSDQRIVSADCGHIHRGTEVHMTVDGTRCSACFERYVFVQNSEDYRSRDDVYQHDSGLYYTFQQQHHDADELLNYSTNVLAVVGPDASIKSTSWGDFLMGVELETQTPATDYFRETREHTGENLCRDYAILKRDGSIGDYGFEIVTAPRGLAEHVQRFKDWEPHRKLRSWEGGRCGLHVHISSKAFTQATLGKLIEFINSPANDQMILAVAGRHAANDGQCQAFCQREGRMVLGNPKATLLGKSTERYRMVNTANLTRIEAERLGMSDPRRFNGRHGTVELRIFRGSLNKARLLAQIEFAHAAVMFCRVASFRDLTETAFLEWLRGSAGLYPHLAKWFGVRQNRKTIDATPEVRLLEEV